MQITIDIIKHMLYNRHKSRYQKIILISTKANIIKGDGSYDWYLCNQKHKE